MTDSGLITAWRKRLEEQTAGLHLADSNHPLQIFIGKTEPGNPRVVVRSAVKPTTPALSSVVLVERYEDQSGKWNLSFTLQDRKFDEVFLRLTDDVHGRSADAPNEKVALDRVGVVFDEWRRLLKPRPSGLLSMEELRGLVGELWLLIHEFSKIRPIHAALEGWLGPMGLPQDFWYPEDGFHEVKSIGPGTTRIRISSESQLDVEELELLVLLIGNTDEMTPGAVNLPKLVSHVSAELGDAAASADALQERLDRLGVNLAESFYHDTWFHVSRITAYDAGPGFPAIRASELPEGLSRVSYQIESSTIEDFKRYSMGVE